MLPVTAAGAQAAQLDSTQNRLRAVHREARMRGFKMASVYATSIAVAFVASLMIDIGVVTMAATVWSLFAAIGAVVGLAAAAFDVINTVPEVSVVLDRPVPMQPARHSTPGVVFLFWDDLNRLSVSSGRAGLAAFSGRIEKGAARYDPQAGLDEVDALLSDSVRLPDEDLARALESLRDRLLLAREHGARFCLIPVTTWSGAIQSNLGLFL